MHLQEGGRRLSCWLNHNGATQGTPWLSECRTALSPPPRLVLTIRPAHGIIQHAGDTSPQGALGRVARVHAPCVVVIAPVQLVLKEISPVIVGPGEDGIDATWREAEVGDGSWVPFLYVVVLKHPVSVSWW